MKKIHAGSFTVPENIEGKPVDVEKRVKKKSVEEAVHFFHVVDARLQNPNTWYDLSGEKGASFTIKKRVSSSLPNIIEVRDFLQVDIPGPGPKNGDGFDLVEVTEIGEDFDETSDESFGITLKACANPAHPQMKETAHFFKGMATSTFIIKRKGQEVLCEYFGRNEVPNLQVDKLTDKIRNAAASFAAIAGVSEYQWSSLVDGLLKEQENQITYTDKANDTGLAST